MKLFEVRNSNASKVSPYRKQWTTKGMRHVHYLHYKNIAIVIAVPVNVSKPDLVSLPSMVWKVS